MRLPVRLPSLLRGCLMSIAVVCLQVWLLLLVIDLNDHSASADLPERLRQGATMLLATAVIATVAMMPLLAVACLLAWLLAPLVRAGPVPALLLGAVLGVVGALVWWRFRLGSLVPGGGLAFVWLGATAGAAFAWPVWRDLKRQRETG